ncbi:AraC family transcriptional regulator [Paenibacillus ginsengarvi]|uniref:AraC family transcriptional regulator n=1 Tax=Paenibacillus ginsengarvi TaxID=400777 RepID=A0A3B0CFV8_9BACL|nr:AraC family transcriptional regulator [Paenibacillus ginsengarvi]RKN84473.1 AraC family transcriptional regulator [Paenibacillus ginsengarvi]
MKESRIRFHHAGDVTVKAGRILGPRTLRDYELVYFPVGSRSVYTANGTAHALDRPCLLVTRPGEQHEYRFDPNSPCRHLFVHFDIGSETELLRYRLFTSSGGCVFPLPDRSLVPQLMKQMLYLFHRHPPRWKVLAEKLLLYMLEELESALEPDGAGYDEQTMPPQISTALHYIDTHASESIGVEQLARLAGWTHEHFTRSFQHYVGHSPKRWIIKRKIDLASQLLLQSSDSVKQIARGIGFADEYYFHRLFRRTMGMTATEYRHKYGDTRMRELAPPDDWGRFYPLNHFFVLEHPANDT